MGAVGAAWLVAAAEEPDRAGTRIPALMARTPAAAARYLRFMVFPLLVVWDQAVHVVQILTTRGSLASGSNLNNQLPVM